MSLADELMKLEQLRASGTLSEQEFQAAKASLLRQQVEGNSLGRAANRYVDFTTTSGTIVLVIFGVFLFVFLIILFAVIIPGFNSMRDFSP
jgi:hypothetical protein